MGFVTKAIINTAVSKAISACVKTPDLSQIDLSKVGKIDTSNIPFADKIPGLSDIQSKIPDMESIKSQIDVKSMVGNSVDPAKIVNNIDMSGIPKEVVNPEELIEGLKKDLKY